MSNPISPFKTMPKLDLKGISEMNDSASDLNFTKNNDNKERSFEINFKSIDLSGLEIQPDNFSAEFIKKFRRQSN